MSCPWNPLDCPGQLAKSAAGGAFIGGGAAIGATNALLAATDSLSEGIVKAATGGTVEQMGHSLLAAGSIQGSTANAAGVLLLSLFAIVATIAVWASLMVRKVL